MDIITLRVVGGSVERVSGRYALEVRLVEGALLGPSVQCTLAVYLVDLVVNRSGVALLHNLPDQVMGVHLCLSG